MREARGVTTLWRTGIRFDRFAEIAAVVPAVEEPLPLSVYLAVAYGGTDREWLRAVSAHRPDGDTAAWLASLDSPAAGHDAALWGAWLDLGVHRDIVRSAVEYGVDPHRVREVSSATGRSVGIVARDIVRWARAGCEPTVEHFAVLARHGVEYGSISADAVDDVMAEAERRGLRGGADRTELAVRLLVLGTRAAVLASLEPHTSRPSAPDADTRRRTP